MGETLDAVRSLRPVLRRLPDSARINFFYGIVLFRHGDYKDALVKYSKALHLQPDYPEALLGQGETLLQLDRPEEALQALKQVIEWQPASWPAWNLMGLCYLRQAEEAPNPAEKTRLLQEARQCFQQVLDVKADHPEARANYNHTLSLLDLPESRLA